MTQIRMQKGYFWCGEERIPPLCGEFHFWRNNILFWDRIFNNIQELGFKQIATYIEWNFHRITPENTPLNEIKYDFTGQTNPQRNLVEFLTQAKQRGFWINLRPGPYIYAETEFGGIPKEMAQYHRNHPEFLKYAKHYLDAVLPVIKPFLATHGGPVFLVQLDNEVSMIKHMDQVIEGDLSDPGSYASFLHEKYGDLSIINEKYGTNWEDWDEIEPIIAPQNPQDFVAYLDGAEFLEWYAALYFKQIAQIYRDNGIDVPFYINSTGPPFPHDPAKLVDSTDLRAADIYYVKKDRLINMLTLNEKLLRATNPLVFSAEFRSGWDIPMTPEDYLFQAALWMGHGIQGVNYFMLVERHRWPYTPIDAVGRPMNPQLFGAFKKIGEIYNQLDLPRFTTNRIYSLQLYWHRLHHFADKQAPLEPGFNLTDPTTNNNVFRALLYGNIPFEIYYPGGSNSCINRKPFLIYAGHSFLEKPYAQALLEYAEQGGHLIFYQNFPYKTPNGKEYDLFSSLLQKSIGIHETHENVMIQRGIGSREDILPTISIEKGYLQEFPLSSMNSDTTPFYFNHMIVGYTQKYQQGQITHIGFPLTARSMEGLLKSLQVNLPFTISPPDVLGTLQTTEDRSELLIGIINPTEETKSVVISLNLNDSEYPIMASDVWILEEMFKATRKTLPKTYKIVIELKKNAGELIYIHKGD